MSRGPAMLREHRRELAVAVVWAALLAVVGLLAPGFYDPANLRDLAINNALVLLPAVAMTFVIVGREIDISIGSQFAVAGVAAGLLAKAGLPMGLVALGTLGAGAAMGALNGWLVAGLGIPSIIVTLGTMVAWRGALRWTTQGAWVQDLPIGFQWFGLGQAAGQALILTVVVLVFAGGWWASGRLAAARAVYAVGSDAEAARLAGIRPAAVVGGTFVLMGLCTALAALLHTVRFSAVQPNAGLGLELKVIAGVVVGGASILGGRGTLLGTALGIVLLGTIGTTLTFLHVDPAWEKAIQGAIILAAVSLDAAGGEEEG